MFSSLLNLLLLLLPYRNQGLGLSHCDETPVSDIADCYVMR